VTHDGFGYRLSGQKVWVANAVASDVVIVFAAGQPDVDSRGISAFLVPMDSKGIHRRARNDSLGVRGLGCMDLDFEDVRVDSDQLLGAPGKGFAIARWALDGGRVAIAAQALGVGQAALDEALAYAKTRVTFGQPIANYQAIQWMLADMATELDAARMLTLKAACAKAARQRVSLEASMAKLYASEAAHRAADKAMQILASAGYRRGSRVERLFRDVRATEIYQGTSEVQRMIIAANVLGA
jgi:butyryl-CoA dehydrogenase